MTTTTGGKNMDLFLFLKNGKFSTKVPGANARTWSLKLQSDGTYKVFDHNGKEVNWDMIEKMIP